MKVVLLVLLLSMAHSHIYSSPPTITYNYDGHPYYYSLYMSL